MMARTKRSRRSYGVGEWGRNRVRVFPDPKTGLYQDLDQHRLDRRCRPVIVVTGGLSFSHNHGKHFEAI